MKYFRKVARYNLWPLEEQIDANPDLWDVHRQRIDTPNFYGTSDIWVRYRAIEELTEPRRFLEPHFATFYPAWHKLTALHPIVYDLMSRLKAVHLGGILITRVPPGGKIKPHSDAGSWHAEFFATKIYIPVKTNDRCVNRCEDESVVMRRGDAWFFNNLVIHSVENDGDTERVTAIVCLRCE